LHARIAMIAFAMLAAFAAGCGGGGSVLSGLTNGGGSTGGNGSGGSQPKSGFYLHIVIPATGGSSQSERRRPKYISSSTTQLAYSVDGNVQTPISLVPSTNTDCAAGPPVTCTVPFSIAPGNHTFSFTLEDASNNPLSGATNVSYTVVAGNANTLNLTLGGIVASVVVQSQTANASRMTGSASNGFQIYGNTAVQFAVVLEDADGNTIVGAMPSPSIAPSPTASFALATPSPGTNVWTLTSSYSATNPALSSNTSLTIVATPVPSSGPTTAFTETVQLQLYQPWIFVLNSGGGGSVTAYDEQGNQKTLSPAFTVSAPQGIAIDNSTDTTDTHEGDIYVTNVGGPSVKAYVPPSTATTLPGAFVGIASPGPVVYDPHNDQLYLANLATSGQTMEAYASGGTAGAGFSTISNIANATALAYDSVDNYIFLASGTGNKIYEFTEAGGAGTTASWTTSLSNPSGLAYDPNWGWIFAANKGSSAITAYNTSGAAQSLSGFSVSSPTAMVFDSHSKTFYVLTSTGMKAFTETSTTGTVSAASLSGTFPNLNTPTEMILVP
jgi:hypothetical protein